MIYVHSLGRAVQFYPGRTALARDGRLLTFRELHTRVEGIAATLTSHGFGAGNRLALCCRTGPAHVEHIGLGNEMESLNRISSELHQFA